LNQNIDTKNEMLRLLDLQNKSTAMVLYATPNMYNKLNNYEFRFYFQFRNGLCNYNDNIDCSRCDNIRNPNQILDHSQVCKGNWSFRHTSIQNLLFKRGKQCGLRIEKEKDIYLNGSFRAADIFIYSLFGGKNVAIDVTITHPVQMKFINKNNISDCKFAVIEEEKLKINTFNKRRSENGMCVDCEFYPFAVSSFGSLGDYASEVLRKVAGLMAFKYHKEYSSMISTLYKTLGIKLAKSNYKMHHRCFPNS